MDHFTHNIIRNELQAITAFPPPDASEWVFSDKNDCVFSGLRHEPSESDDNAPPEVWVKRGVGAMRSALSWV